MLTPSYCSLLLLEQSGPYNSLTANRAINSSDNDWEILSPD